MHKTAAYTQAQLDIHNSNLRCTLIRRWTMISVVSGVRRSTTSSSYQASVFLSIYIYILLIWRLATFGITNHHDIRLWTQLVCSTPIYWPPTSFPLELGNRREVRYHQHCHSGAASRKAAASPFQASPIDLCKIYRCNMCTATEATTERCEMSANHQPA